ncbi:thiamine diphosphokinase [Rhodovulum adriaticum]|uniref:Thiamine diphosphokinase n=1 Tax=Rhodovulum adriaticum TaxID=35804 RepID=A0A4V2SM90_RHOAD|nr:thiamine diphosphokinase [Rhodovulum adriaticum]MBK1635211.1 thiamine diphosphokinase [Rhodovulum adriaticum]TCP26346.1 thiamine pyrophosphokinase [Rhodovulum adriaticum]
MPTQILQSSASVTLLGGGEVSDAQLARALAHAPVVAAADGGADSALARGHVPQAVIGDFDSISSAARAAIPPDRQHVVAEQESTDFEKCLRAITAPLVLGLGFLGPRIDHQLAALNTLVRFPDRRCILLGDEDLCFACPPDLALDLPVGTRLSLFPMAGLQGHSTGLHWPIEGLDFAPDGRVGTSNRVAGPVRLRMARAGMLVILPQQQLDAAIAGLMAAPPRG